MSLASTKTFFIRVSEVNPNRRIGLASLWQLMQEAAWENAASLKASTYDLQKRGITWVMSRGRIEVFRYPKHRETITVETWPSGQERSFLYRDYRVYDAEGTLIAQATTTWLVLDFEERKMVSVPQDLGDILLTPEEKPPLERSRGKMSLPDPKHAGTLIPVQFHDLDINQHVNNSRYIRWLLESQAKQLLAGKQVRLLEFQLRAECLLGNQLRSVADWDPEQQAYRHAIWRVADGKIISQGRSVWE
ncbi:MAG: acyl-ACP thioesterase domain-containing protein [Bacteroidota bacterium]